MSKLLTGAPWLHAMARVFDNAGAQLYLVGGAVRNPLMGLPVSDIDVCGPARAETVCAFCEGTPVRARLRAAQFGTVELYVTDEAGCEHMAEYTAWRQDVYLHGHRPDSVRFTTDISVDASRRDFSVNALYRRVHEDGLEEVTDPTGGLAHLAQGLLHTVKPDPDLVLREDGQRILRAARFQAELGLAPTDAMLESLCRHVHLLGELTGEMLRDELVKIMMADLRYPGLKRRRPASLSGLEALNRIGAWSYLFGDLPYDEQAASALEHLSVQTLPVRIALLLRKLNPEQAADVMHRLRFPARETEQACACLRAMHGVSASALTELAKLGLPALQAAQAVYAAFGDECGTHAVQNALDRLAGKPLSLKELALSGSELKPVFLAQNRPVREMGQVLESLWQAVLEGSVPNERGALMNHPIVTGGVQYR